MITKPLLGAAMGLALAGVAQADEPRSVGASHLFAPQGYDDNDEIVVVASGFLPNTCYQLTTPLVKTNLATRTISIDLKSHVNPNPCVNVPVPFEQEVDLGSLPVGDWTLETTIGSLRTTLNVVQSPNESPDAYLYAPIDQVNVSFDAGSGRWTALLTGDLLASCLEIKETKVLGQGAVVVLLPILEQRDDVCQPTSEHFNLRVLLPEDLNPGLHLLHVRSLNGRGLNRIFDVRL
jgi:hypothetical protein